MNYKEFFKDIAIWWGMLYAIFSVGAGELDISQWGADTRGFAAFMMFITGVIIFAANTE